MTAAHRNARGAAASGNCPPRLLREYQDLRAERSPALPARNVITYAAAILDGESSCLTELSGPIGSLLKTTGGNAPGHARSYAARKAPRPQQRRDWALVAESAVIVQRHRISARAGVRRTCGVPLRRAEGHQHACLVVQARGQISQLRKTPGAPKPVLPGFVGDLERKNLVLAPARKRREAIHERGPRQPLAVEGAPPNSVHWTRMP